MTDPITAHIQAASHAAEEAVYTQANPTIHAAIAQAHALTAVAMLLERLLALVEEDEEAASEPAKPLLYTVAHIVGGEILH
jgi:hypothetical protein